MKAHLPGKYILSKIYDVVFSDFPKTGGYDLELSIVPYKDTIIWDTLNISLYKHLKCVGGKKLYMDVWEVSICCDALGVSKGFSGSFNTRFKAVEHLKYILHLASVESDNAFLSMLYYNTVYDPRGFNPVSLYASAIGADPLERDTDYIQRTLKHPDTGRDLSYHYGESVASLGSEPRYLAYSSVRAKKNFNILPEYPEEDNHDNPIR